jgi:hypothetical protein
MSTKGFEFNRVTFGLPIESYRVDAYITRDERLPVVTEYVLRLLRVCGSVTLAGLRNFFGFTDAEALAVVDSLNRQGLVEASGEDLLLSSYANERFDQSSSDDYPRFTKVEPRRDSVTFDLLSFSPINARSFGLLTENSFRLDVSDEALGNSVERAKAAYYKRFHEIASFNEDLRRDAMSVYSVEDISSKRRGYLPVPVTFSISEQEQVERKGPKWFEEGAAPELSAAFHETVSGAIPNSLTLGNAHLEKFIDAFEASWLGPYVTGKRFDIHGFARDVAAGELSAPKGVRPVFGNLYLQHNLEQLINRIKARRNDQRLRFLCTSAAWLAPDHYLWGRGEAFQQATAALQDSLHGKVNDELAVFIGTEHGQEQVVANQFRGVDSGQFHAYRPANAGDATFGGRLELFLYPTGFAAALFHLALPGSPGLWAPIGFISSAPKHVAHVHKLLLTIVGGSAYGGRLENRNQPRREPQNFANACGFLNYSDLRTHVGASEADDAAD